jgi:hypothetical protein
MVLPPTTVLHGSFGCYDYWAMPLMMWRNWDGCPSTYRIVGKESVGKRKWHNHFEIGTYLRTESVFTPSLTTVALLQYVWGQYAMHNLGANSPRPPVDKFTNFMVGRNPLVIERLLPHSKFQVASSQGPHFSPPKFCSVLY